MGMNLIRFGIVAIRKFIEWFELDYFEYSSDSTAISNYVINNSQIRIIDEYQEGLRDADSSIAALHPSTGASGSANGQTFTAPINFKLTSCKFYLLKGGSPIGRATAQLFATSNGVPTGTALATSATFDISTLTGSYALVTFNFSIPYECVASTVYAICFVAPASGTLGGANYVSYGIDASSPTHPGKLVAYASSTWTAYDAYDSILYIYGHPINEGTGKDRPETVLLLRMNGTEGSSTFVDDTGKAVTPADNAQICTAQSKFGGSSFLLVGATDRLSLADSEDWNFGAGDFTVHGWFYSSTLLSSPWMGIWQHRTDNNHFISCGIENGVVSFLVYNNGWAVNCRASSATGIAANTWTHIAWVKTSGTYKIFVGGVEVQSIVDADNPENYTGSFQIGIQTNEGGDSGYYKGYIDEFQVVKGIALYTTNFTPPTLPTNSFFVYSESTIKEQGDYSLKGIARATTSLNQSVIKTIATPLDLSEKTAIKYDIRSSRTGSNIKTVLHNGVDSYTKFLATFDGADGTKPTTAYTGQAMSWLGTAQIDTAIEDAFGGNSGALMLDGDSDWVTIPDEDNLRLDSADFTIELFCRPTSFPGSAGVLITKRFQAGTQSFLLYVNVAGEVKIHISSNGSTWDIANALTAGQLTQNVWSHVEIGRSGSNWYSFVDGVAGATWSSAAAISDANGALLIGADSAGGNYFPGYIDEVRISKGICRHTEAFTPRQISYITTIEHTPNIISADTWQTETIDLSAVTDEGKNNIDSIKLEIVNADAENIFYIDNMIYS